MYWACVARVAGARGSRSTCPRSPPSRRSSSTGRARIYELDGSGVTTPEYDDLQAVSLTRGFLAAPERYLMALDSDAPEEDE
jgi:hypothetical protein